jgi:hypothetical protein
VEANAVMTKSPKTIDQETTLIAHAKEDPTAPMRLAPERIVPRRPEK